MLYLKAKAAPKQEHQSNKVYVVRLEANICIGVVFFIYIKDQNYIYIYLYLLLLKVFILFIYIKQIHTSLKTPF